MDSDSLKHFEISIYPSSICSNFQYLLPSPYMSLGGEGTNTTNFFFKLMIQQLVKIQLCSLYCGNTHYPSLWRTTVFKLHGQKSKITLQFIPNGKRPATDVCVNLMLQSEDMHCLTSNPITTTETSG